MCGIFGYVAHGAPVTVRSVLEMLLSGLSKVEYRGYDSAGLCVDGAPVAASAPALDTADDDHNNEQQRNGSSGERNGKEATTTTHHHHDPATATTPLLVRCAGNIAALREEVFAPATTAHVALDVPVRHVTGIAHTRWATHGEVSVRNCHPQRSNSGDFTLVHNGIMTNYRTVKQLLLDEGYHFTSDTDTEVIAVLAEYLYTRKGVRGSFVALVTQLSRLVEGAYALLLQSTHYPGELVGCRRGSPLVVAVRERDTGALYDNGDNDNGQQAAADHDDDGNAYATPTTLRNAVTAFNKNSATLAAAAASAAAAATSGKTNATTTTTATTTATPVASPTTTTVAHSPAVEVFIASDSNSFVAHTRHVVYLEDEDVVYCDAAGRLHIYAAHDMPPSTAAVTREVRVLATTLESLSRGDFAHFMLKEIHEQGDTVASALRGRVDFDACRVRLGGFSAAHVRNVRQARRIVLLACGTSLHSCVAVRPLMDELLPGIAVSVENAADFVDRAPAMTRADVCVFVSQSGETADTLMALQHCRAAGALCVGVTNVVASSISRLTDFGVHLNAGAEVGVASTKAYTSQVVVLTLMTLLLSADDAGSVERRRAIVHALAELPSKIVATLQRTAPAMVQLARTLSGSDVHALLVLGRGYDFATALEAALKIKELSYVHAEGMHSGELKHGPLALVDATLPVLALCSHDTHFAKSKAAVQQVHARKGRVTVFTNTDDLELADAAERVIALPSTVDCLQCIINVLPFQLLAYHMALQRGHNVDCPRNLAKSVTVQ